MSRDFLMDPDMMRSKNWWKVIMVQWESVAEGSES